jgi:antitoxin component YwqK of YwqJK toxin-antitoxin module
VTAPPPAAVVTPPASPSTVVVTPRLSDDPRFVPFSAYQASPYYGGYHPYSGTSTYVAGSGVSGGVSVGGRTGEPVLDSVMTGAALGGLGGPIGLAVGAGIGLLHGLWAKKKAEAASRAEVAKQKEADRKLEQEIAAQKPGASADEQGVRVVKDHLADTPNASPPTGTAVASLPPTAPNEPPAARDRLDPDGLRPVYEGDRLVRKERVAADGKVTEVLHYDARGQLVKREESSRGDGRFDTSTFYADGKPQRRESDTDGDGTTDLWAAYDATGEIAKLESLANGRRHQQIYAAGKVTEEEWRRASDGVVTGRVKYQDGKVREKLEGNLVQYFEPNGDLKREEELGADGRPSAIAFYEHGKLVRRELYEIDEKAFERVPLVTAETPGTVTR